MKRNFFLRFFAPVFIRGERWAKFRAVTNNVIAANFLKGIPFESDSIDVAYHSHLLEHFDRDYARKFLTEVKRVLRPGGVQRIVVPDFETLCNEYLSHVSLCGSQPENIFFHDDYVSSLIEQSVRRESFGTSRQKRYRRLFENLILGDARKRGETHQWMYDRFNLKALLLNIGFREVNLQKYDTSLISGWNSYGLDVDENGKQYKPKSLYVEAIK